MRQQSLHYFDRFIITNLIAGCSPPIIIIIIIVNIIIVIIIINITTIARNHIGLVCVRLIAQLIPYSTTSQLIP